MPRNPLFLVFPLLVLGCSGSDPVDSDPVDTDTEDPGCAGLSEQTCGQLEGCVAILGTRVNGAEQYAGCAADTGACGDAPAAAEDPSDGACWDFVDQCVPDGWTILGASCSDI